MLINPSNIYFHIITAPQLMAIFPVIFLNMPSPYITIIHLCHTSNKMRRFFPSYALTVFLILHSVVFNLLLGNLRKVYVCFLCLLFLEAVALKDAKITLSKTLFYGDNSVQNTYTLII